MIVKCMLIPTLIILLLFSCDQGEFDGDIKNGNRDLVVDIDNSIFNSTAEVNSYDKGPGVNKIVFTASLSGGGGNIENIVEAADLNNTYKYTQISFPVSGELTQLDVMAYKGTELLYSTAISDKSSFDYFFGWEVFANVKKFKLGIQKNIDDWASASLLLDIAPRGGNNVKFKIDSGVTAVIDEQTDWGGAALTSRQIAVEPILNENPTGLTFDIYTLIADENLMVLYKPDYLTEEANYEYHPWKDVWNYEEITETGLKIGDTTYTLTKYNTGDPLSFIEPHGAGYDSFLIDLTTETADPLGKYLLVALVMNYDILSVPTSISVVEIE